MTSHHAVLARLVAELPEGSSVLEYGSGESTRIILAGLRGGKFVSVEHDPRWYTPVCKTGVEIFQLLKPAQVPYGGSEDYVTCPLAYGPFDFILVDGRNRADCLALSSLMLKPDGVVMLHDAERQNYHSGFPYFSERQDLATGSPHTVLLRKPKFAGLTHCPARILATLSLP